MHLKKKIKGKDLKYCANEKMNNEKRTNERNVLYAAKYGCLGATVSKNVLFGNNDNKTCYFKRLNGHLKHDRTLKTKCNSHL